MKQKFLRAKTINDQLNEIEKFYQPITRFAYVQQDYARIIIPSNLANGGRVMTYKQSKNYIKKYAPKSPVWTYEEYKQEVKDFISQYGDRLTVEGEKEYRMEQARNTLNDMKAWINAVEISELTDEQITAAFREVYEMQQREGMGEQGYESSSRFYPALAEALRRQGASIKYEDETDLGVF